MHDDVAASRDEARVSAQIIQATELLEQQEKARRVQERREAQRSVSSIFPFKAMGVQGLKGPVIGACVL